MDGNDVRAPDGEASALPLIEVTSTAELRAHETEILDRIHRTPNGEFLFLLNPFRLLGDVGVVLGAEFRLQLVRKRPHLTARSSMAYEAMRKTRKPQAVQARVRRLFAREDE